jgi:NADH-quinone oxidoreductase subunit N
MLVFIRILFNVFSNVLFFFQPILVVAALGSMFVGAMGALKQLRIKRFIAYTSINQIGFLFFGLASCNLIGLIATLIYLMLYVSMSLNFFTILLNTEHMVTKRGMLYLSDLYCFSSYNTESSKHLVLTIMSMAGLPPLGGFIGKLFLYFAVMEAKLDTALFISLLISMVSTYYYLSFVRYV